MILASGGYLEPLDSSRAVGSVENGAYSPCWAAAKSVLFWPLEKILSEVGGGRFFSARFSCLFLRIAMERTSKFVFFLLAATAVMIAADRRTLAQDAPSAGAAAEASGTNDDNWAPAPLKGFEWISDLRTAQAKTVEAKRNAAAPINLRRPIVSRPIQNRVTQRTTRTKVSTLPSSRKVKPLSIPIARSATMPSTRPENRKAWPSGKARLRGWPAKMARMFPPAIATPSLRIWPR